MNNCISIRPDLKKQILSTLHIQIDVFHYEKILIIGKSTKHKTKVLLQTDSIKYKPLALPDEIKLPDQRAILLKDLDSDPVLKNIFDHYQVNALFPIVVNGRCEVLMAIYSRIPTFTERQLDVGIFITRYISNMLYNDNLVSNLKYYSERLEKILNEMGTLHEITHALESIDNLDSLLEYIMRKSQTVMQAESASMMLVIEETHELEFKVTLGPKASKVKPFRLPIGKGIAGWVAETGKPVLIPDCYSDSRFDPSFDKRSGYHTRTMLSVPMVHKSRVIGVMSILNRLDGKPFDENDQMLFTIFAAQAALSIENARLLYSAIEKERIDKELQVASEIQHLLIPQSIPQTDFLDIAAEYIPCKEVGGDFYDVISVDENRYIFIVADVSGKGIPGAMVVSNMQATLRAYLEYSVDLIPITTKLNEAIIRQTTPDRYITFFIALYDHQASTISYINAGHNPPLIVDKNGSVRELRTGGIFIGYVPWEYEAETIPFNRGDTLIMYTDGLVEAMNSKEEEFELSRLKEITRDHRDLSGRDLRQKIIQTVTRHIGRNPMEDDFTLLIARRI